MTWRTTRTPGTGSGAGRLFKGAALLSADDLHEGDLIYCDYGVGVVNLARAVRRVEPPGDENWYCTFVDPQDTTKPRLPTDFEWVLFFPRERDTAWQFFRAVERPLTDVMDFDHVIEVHADGSITDGPEGVYAPSLYDDELDDTSWTLLNGYSGQDRYSGPVMHNSEYIGGQMERDIRERPGLYVAIVATWPTDDETDDEGDDVEGWAVAYKETA